MTNLSISIMTDKELQDSIRAWEFAQAAAMDLFDDEFEEEAQVQLQYLRAELTGRLRSARNV